MKVYTTQDHATPNYVRNADLWAVDFAQALTALSPWNSSTGPTKAGVLVSPRHVLFATHFTPATGCTIRFVAADGTVCDRTLSAVQSLTTTDAPNYYPDITVGVLDSDVDTGISFAKVFSAAAITNKLPDLNVYHPPAAGTDQEEKLLVRNWTNMPTTTGATAYCAFQAPGSSGDDVNRSAFYENFVSGDSGSPQFVFVNGDMVLLTVVTFGGAGAGTSVTAFTAAINAAMTRLGGGYQLTEVDVSGFANL